jgi:hypothetical protein
MDLTLAAKSELENFVAAVSPTFPAIYAVAILVAICSMFPPLAAVTMALATSGGIPAKYVSAIVSNVGRGLLTSAVTVLLRPKLLSSPAKAFPILLITELPELYWGSVNAHITRPPLL